MTSPHVAPGRMFEPEAVSAGRSHFDLEDDRAYARWRARKLAVMASSPEQLMVPIRDPSRLTDEERTALLTRVSHCNMAFYRCAGDAGMDRSILARFGEALGLNRLDNHLCADEDGISELRVSQEGPRADYIPYTDRPLSWHCDGYYNAPGQRIRAMLLHCVCDAETGGGNTFLDHELLYIALRDENPAWIAALSHDGAFTIPANVNAGVTLREARTGPVFSVDPVTGHLHMRYTARLRNIVWRDDATTLEAAARIRALLSGEAHGILRHRLRPGEGVICNNVLHARDGFTDAPGHGRQRLVYRARYLDRVADTGEPRNALAE